MDPELGNSSIHFKRKRVLTNEECQAIFDILVVRSDNGKVTGALFKEIAESFFICDKTDHRIWEQGLACVYNGSMVDVSFKLQGRVDRKHVQINVNQFTSAHYRVIRPHSNALKPYLSEESKKARLRFCLSKLEPNTLEAQPMFKNMYNYVHMDKKWFYMSRESERYYLLPEEPEPHHTCKSKRFITKVKFLATIARPRFDANRNPIFFGKIGIFPFNYKEPAKRSSKNRAAGTLETKAITAGTKEITRSSLIEKVLPAIRSKWPRSGAVETIYLQQDNAGPHIHGSDPKFLEAASRDEFDMHLSFQPPSSPDMNVLDLGFFRLIQSLQHQQASSTIDQLVGAAEKSFEELSPDNLDHVFLSLQASMIEVMKVYGDDNYKLPQIGKAISLEMALFLRNFIVTVLLWKMHYFICINEPIHVMGLFNSDKETQFTAEMGSIPKKPPCGGNFTMEEDKLLVSTWLNTSMDPIQATSGKKRREGAVISGATDGRKNKDITSSTQFAGALDEIKECKTKLVEKKLEMLEKTCDQEEEKICIKKGRLEMDKFKEDERVMMMDLNGLSEEQQEFYMYRKMEILEKRRVK
ncbi:hypothetical protein RHSIM_Rhsim02G0188400 [Rhododendron simsii]|uniref:Transposase n=1 Tax=Rhododendron simsii TaxID=118357 RepID=A0A834LS85_RHOSS|nr:hypothetical protein RHSIM_Rhsim02G0188400 [Rhododendron simsii]